MPSYASRTQMSAAFDATSLKGLSKEALHVWLVQAVRIRPTVTRGPTLLCPFTMFSPILCGLSEVRQFEQHWLPLLCGDCRKRTRAAMLFGAEESSRILPTRTSSRPFELRGVGNLELKRSSSIVMPGVAESRRRTSSTESFISVSIMIDSL